MADGDAARFDMVALDAFLVSVGHNRLLGQRYHACSDDWIELSMPWDARFVADAETGEFAPGPLVTLLDNATGVSIWLRRGGIKPQVTIDLRIDHLRPSTRGVTIIARCGCHRIADNLAFVDGFAYEGTPENQVARVSGTFMLLEEAAQ